MFELKIRVDRFLWTGMLVSFSVSLPKTLALVSPTPQVEKVDQREEKSDRG
jgi:hypothetical protein